ncbi:hypothetical protein J6590_037349 [Homalodisca vitripennis]|nr:hypothetical protein J6590_037349 [Homalodisca vitripennis]
MTTVVITRSFLLTLTKLQHAQIHDPHQIHDRFQSHWVAAVATVALSSNKTKWLRLLNNEITELTWDKNKHVVLRVKTLLRLYALEQQTNKWANVMHQL